MEKIETIISFGAGVQTTALAILAVQGKVNADQIVFADTKGEKPETYWYMEAYTIPMLKQARIGFQWLENTSKYDGVSLYDYSVKHRFLPGMPSRQCSAHFKASVIHRAYPKALKMIGFNTDELRRAENPVHSEARFPLIEMGLSGSDCTRIIQDYGWPVPVKSSCFFCPYQRPYEWNWMKDKHPDLFKKSLDLEEAMYSKHPQKRLQYGLFGGKPLWKFAKGIQQEFLLQENSCWTGACGH
jgi:hypothetical protein